MGQECNHCAKVAQPVYQKEILSLYLRQPVAGFEPWTLGLWVKSWTTELPRSKLVSKDLLFLFSLFYLLEPEPGFKPFTLGL